jgi:hypothetical protein
LAVKFFAASVLFDDHIRDLVDPLVGGEALPAFETLAPTADGLRLFALARVDHLVIRKSAKGTFHDADVERNKPCKAKTIWKLIKKL